MSIWIYPKTDWHPSNEEGVSGDDFNRIEKNAEYLYDRQERHIDISGTVSHILTEGYGNVSEGWGRNLQCLNVNIPDGYKLECTHVRIGGLRTGFSITCVVGDETTHAKAGNGDISLVGNPITLFANTSGSDQEKAVIVYVQNETGGTTSIYAMSWIFNLRLVPIT